VLFVVRSLSAYPKKVVGVAWIGKAVAEDDNALNILLGKSVEGQQCEI
jgi:hypothetical protein